MKIGSRKFKDEKTYIMGILNVTPDSFSDGGKFDRVETALIHVKDMIDAGADIIDIGGESTRPGHGPQISDEEEKKRVLPVIHAIKERFDIPVSLDTYKPAVAEAGILEGVDMINDIWGLRYDPRMAEVIAEYDVPACLMHNREKADYKNFLEEVEDDLKETLRIAERAGIKQDKIILDPGLGFGKNYEQNLIVLANLEYFKRLNMPLLLGSSRKSVIGMTLDLPVEEREEGTIVTSVLAVQAGYQFVRVHNVAGNKRALRMTEAILEQRVRE
ncbi:dihydropteroate synthase [Anaerolentibacter hominis]|uniref:dihydropteroate synthase n=1 Tax=Anaerolentibacter hominis TaxID=3079009 RepID=UPI0031B80475